MIRGSSLFSVELELREAEFASHEIEHDYLKRPRKKQRHRISPMPLMQSTFPAQLNRL
jgi:hypothetical protein